MQEVIAKNKEGIVKFNECHWDHVSPEAKDLVMKMTAICPEERISAKEALMHPWFTLENINESLLSNAQMNMKKYHDENRFNVEKIKPEFSMITCSPLLNSRLAGRHDSPPLDLSKLGNNPSPFPSPLLIPAHNPMIEDNSNSKVFLCILF